MLLPLYRFALLVTLLAGTCSVAFAQQSLGELYATDASVKGSVILANSGTSVLSGSSIEAGTHAATLKLERGGMLLICSGTNLSVTASKSGREMMFSLNSGDLEMNYPLGASADTLLTPDFHLLMPGPGTVHLAVKVTPQGDTCIQSLPWNASAIVVSENMGDATYQVKPDEAIMFHAGKIEGATHAHQNCGCPTEQPVPLQVAKTASPAPAAQPPSAATDAGHAAVLATPATTPIVVDAPLSFHGSDPGADLAPLVATLRLDNKHMLHLDPVVVPPPSRKKSSPRPAQAATATAAPHGLFAKLGAFFSGIFH
jgi:hypothetical protein